MQERLQRSLGLKVHIEDRHGRGKVIIEYSRLEDFDTLLEQLGSDELLLFSTDYPHWHFDGADAVPDGFSPSLLRKICADNPRATYARLMEPVR